MDEDLSIKVKEYLNQHLELNHVQFSHDHYVELVAHEFRIRFGVSDDLVSQWEKELEFTKLLLKD